MPQPKKYTFDNMHGLVDSGASLYALDSSPGAPTKGTSLFWDSDKGTMSWQQPPISVPVPYQMGGVDADGNVLTESITFAGKVGTIITGSKHSQGGTLVLKGGGYSPSGVNIATGTVYVTTTDDAYTVEGSPHLLTLVDSDSTHSISTSPVNDSDTDTDTVRLRVLDRVVVPSIAFVHKTINPDGSDY